MLCSVSRLRVIPVELDNVTKLSLLTVRRVWSEELLLTNDLCPRLVALLWVEVEVKDIPVSDSFIREELLFKDLNALFMSRA